MPHPRALLLALLALLLLPAVALGHAERATFYPEHDKGALPAIGASKGRTLIVCKQDSSKRVRQIFRGSGPKTTRLRKGRLRQVRKCKFAHVQRAVDAARSGDRILLLPGVYREEPSRALPVRDPKCESPAHWESSGDNHQEDGRVPTYLHQVDCPNSRNLIAVIGDSITDADKACDQKCNLTIEGLGRQARDVVLEGDRRKQDVLRVDRADGFQLRNVTVEQGAYNNVDLVEVNGFRLSKLVSRWASHYGVLTFTSDNGLYEDIEAYGSGDSGVYPGSGPELHCRGYGIEMRRINSYGNTLGSSGTAGNGTWTHDSRFHDNAAGIANDSFAPGHPGMPQDCSKWTDNRISSNNLNLFEDANEAYCIRTPFEQRRKEVVCPVFQVVVGVGFMLYGVNENLFTGNRIWDQHRSAVRLFGVPAAARGEMDPTKAYDTSHGNRFTGNVFGVRPDGTPDRNGVDVFWDEQGIGNCWEGNTTAKGAAVTSDPPKLPTCRGGGSTNPLGNSLKLAADLPCIQWHPTRNPDPPGCDWFTTPEDPGDGPSTRTAFRAASPLASLAPVSVTQRVAPAAPGTSAQGPLRWKGTPQAARPSALPADRLVTGRLENTSSMALPLDTVRARVLDDAGRTVRGTSSFAAGFSHGLYGAGVAPKEAMPDFQARRLGVRTVLQPGESVPFTVAWRATPGTTAPTRVDFGEAVVGLPATD
ncbi:MAG: hypothetical protein JWO90_3082 [Solirubrobacterales bacterium]|jgi:hypothetical protein|nr:hypothetical protein [Solirubrobacterales bacterium]